MTHTDTPDILEECERQSAHFTKIIDESYVPDHVRQAIAGLVSSLMDTARAMYKAGYDEGARSQGQREEG